MMVSKEIAAAVYRKVKLIREEYRTKVLKGDANVISIERLQWVIEGMYDLKIKKRLVPFDATFVRGMIERWTDLVIISVRQEQTEDWLRFTAVKEMCHVVIDEKEDWSTLGVSTLESVLVEYGLSNGKASARATQSEAFAEVAAIELLYPYETRLADLEKLEIGSTTMVKIASEQKLPASIVSRALSSQHQMFAAYYWAEADKA